MKKSEINKKLVSDFGKVTSQPNNIEPRTCTQRLCRQPPPEFDVMTSDLDTPFHLIRDRSLGNPSFENNLYRSLDIQLVLLYILWFLTIVVATENAMLAIFIVYCLEKSLQWLRQFLGKRNLVAKSMCDQNFLM